MQSGILNFEEQIPYPNVELAVEQGFDKRVLDSFTAQLYLRKTLNQVHQMLYDPNRAQPQSEFGVVDYVEAALTIRFVPEEFQFAPDDPPATDILSARLRAKYWGAQVITYRPFIRQIVHLSMYGPTNHSPSSADLRAEPGVPPLDPEVMTGNDVDPRMVEYARRGIHALIQSTRAFHGLVSKRFIVTNIFGTAHA